jgi:hypothetical protein
MLHTTIEGAIINNNEPIMKHQIAMVIVLELYCKDNTLPTRNNMAPTK